MKKLLIVLALLASTSVFAATPDEREAKVREQSVECQDYEYLLKQQNPETASSFYSVSDKPQSGDTLEKQIAFNKAKCDAQVAQTRLPAPSLGMSAKQVVEKTNWGRPNQINRTITRRGTREQWVYDGQYLYFENGVLTAAQD